MTDINSLKIRVEAAKTAKLRADVAYEAAVERRDKSMQQLQEKFGLDNLSDARAKLAELQAVLNSRVEEAEQILDNMGF